MVAPELVAPSLALAPAYADEVRKSDPWGYWRFEALHDGLVPNEVADRPPLRVSGPLQLAGAPGENRSAEFRPGQPEQALVMDGTWAPPRGTGYAVELWALSEGFNVSALVSLIADTDTPAENHTFLLELLARSKELLHEPCAVRYLDRWPPGTSGGGNVFSRSMYIPYRWYHVVAQKVGGRLELYIDGELVGATQAEPKDDTTACRLLVGRLKQAPQTRPGEIRPFVGRLDELAVYGHPLSAEEIRRHYELGTEEPR
jgi:hypothetical protein